MSYLKNIALAAAFVIGGAGTAAATEASVALHVRAGPSTAYQVVDTLYAGESVNVGECRTNGWCAITHDGPDGWVSASYLTNIDRAPAPRDDRRNPPVSSSPDVSVNFSVPGFSFQIGNGRDFRVRPGRHAGRVCFYDRPNFRGAGFCVTPNSTNPRLGSFNDRISSIRVTGDAQVRVCEHFNFEGRCAVLDKSQANLGNRNDNIISSYRVR